MLHDKSNGEKESRRRRMRSAREDGVSCYFSQCHQAVPNWKGWEEMKRKWRRKQSTFGGESAPGSVRAYAGNIEADMCFKVAWIDSQRADRKWISRSVLSRWTKAQITQVLVCHHANLEFCSDKDRNLLNVKSTGSDDFHFKSMAVVAVWRGKGESGESS